MQLAQPLASETARVNVISRRELVWVVLGFAVAITLFLGPAIFTGRYLSSWDLSYQYYPWQAQPPAGWVRPANASQFDSTLEFEPWLAYSAARLHDGALPLWNPENGLGAPFLANMQSAIFYPPNWFYFLWQDRTFLVVRVWLNMLVAALGMYALARKVARVGPAGASVASVMFTFGGFVTSWAMWPHMNVAVWLPWLWWATARLIDMPSFRRLTALAGFVALSVLAGQPEITYYTALATGLFALFLVATGGPLRPARILQSLGWWAAAYLVGMLIASIQLLPFLDYLAQSMSLVTRAEQGGHRLWLPLPYLWTAVAPDLLGNPARGTVWSPALIGYNASNMYTGLLGLLLAPLALMVPAQRRLGVFLCGLVVLSLCVVYHAPLIYDVITNSVPLMRLAPNYRLQLVIHLALALLAALGVEALVTQLARPRGLMIVLGCTVALLAVVGVVVPWLFVSDWFDLPTPAAEGVIIWRDALVRAIVVLIGSVALLVGIVALGHRRPGWLPGLLALLPLALWADLTQARIDFNPTIAPIDYAPPTAATTFLQQHAGLSRVAALGRTMMPDSNMYYGLTDLRSYDAMEPQTYRDMTTQIDSELRDLPGGLITLFQVLNSPVVNLLGVRYIMTVPGDDPNLVPGAHQDSSTTPVGEIYGTYRPGQTFVAAADNLSQIQVLGATYARPLTGTLIFHLKLDPNAPTDLVTQDVPLAGLADNSWWKISFPPLRQSAGRKFYFYLESPSGHSGEAATLWYQPDDQYNAGTRMESGKAAAGDLAFRTFSFTNPDAPRFTKVLDGGTASASVFLNRDALPRVWLAHSAEVVPDRADLLARLADSSFPATTTVLLTEPLPDALPLPAAARPFPLEGDKVTITNYTPESVEIVAHSNAPGVLVLADQYFSGWEATVDDTPATILPVDRALRGVYLPDGDHRVRFAYVPPAFWAGTVISATALFVTVGLLVWSRRRKAMHTQETFR
jgi:hypothetical protein